MNCFLAAAELEQTPASAASPAPSWIALPADWPTQSDLLHWCHNMSPGTATILLIGGAVYLLFGIYMYRTLITLNASRLASAARIDWCRSPTVLTSNPQPPPSRSGSRW